MSTEEWINKRGLNKATWFGLNKEGNPNRLQYRCTKDTSVQ